MSESTSETIDDGGPAFPTGIQPNDYMHPGMPFECGMTLRDWFAGQALCGIQACCNSEDWPEKAWHNDAALSAYEAADAMLLAREAGNGMPSAAN